MLTTPHIRQIAVDAANVRVFEIAGGVGSDEMAEMAKTVNAAFDRGETIRMLLLLRGFDMGDATAGVNLDVMKSQARSLTHVERYAVVGAPKAAAAMIEMSAPFLPVEAKTFAAGEEAEAWAFVGARPPA